MKKILCFVSFFYFVYYTKAQEVINTSGNTIKGTEITYAYSIGEVSGFSLKPSCTFTQGVIQPIKYSCSPANYDFTEFYEIAIYPNPTNDVVIIETDYPDFSFFKIIASDGRVLQTGKFNYSSISFKNLPKGLYLLQLFSSDSKIRRSFKIIKN